MVSIRCKTIVKTELEKLGIETTVMELGEVEIKGNLSDGKLQLLKAALLKHGQNKA